MLADLRGKSVNAIILRKYNENQTQKKKKKTMEKNRKNSFNHVFHCYLADYWEFVWYDIMKAMH